MYIYIYGGTCTLCQHIPKSKCVITYNRQTNIVICNSYNINVLSISRYKTAGN